MLIERTNTEVIIRIPASVNTDDLQAMLNYVRYKEIVSKFKVSQKKVDALAKQAQKDWWKKNRKRLIS